MLPHLRFRKHCRIGQKDCKKQQIRGFTVWLSPNNVRKYTHKNLITLPTKCELYNDSTIWRFWKVFSVITLWVIIIKWGSLVILGCLFIVISLILFCSFVSVFYYHFHLENYRLLYSWACIQLLPWCKDGLIGNGLTKPESLRLIPGFQVVDWKISPTYILCRTHVIHIVFLPARHLLCLTSALPSGFYELTSDIN